MMRSAPSNNQQNANLIEQVITAVRATIGNARGLHEPEFLGNELTYLKECLDTGWVSSAGPFVNRFESLLAEYTGVEHAIAMVTGTAALQVALQLAGVGQDDEVIMPSVTFVATANAAAYLNAHPHFADSTEDSFGIDVERLSLHLSVIAERRNGQTINRETGRRIAAVMCMHTFGHPVDLDPLVELCNTYALPLIEDAAEALGSTYKGQHVGHHGLMSTFSFNGNKIATTGGGGALVTNNAELAARARHLSSTAKAAHRWNFFHDEIGYNFRMPNLNAALGCAQLERLEDMLADKRRLAGRYSKNLSHMSGIHVLQEPSYAKSNHWLNAIVLTPEYAGCRDALLEALNTESLASRPLWTPMHMLPMYQSCPHMDLTVAESLFSRTINIPSGAHLGR